MYKNGNKSESQVILTVLALDDEQLLNGLKLKEYLFNVVNSSLAFFFLFFFFLKFLNASKTGFVLKLAQDVLTCFYVSFTYFIFAFFNSLIYWVPTMCKILTERGRYIMNTTAWYLGASLPKR